MIHDLIINIEKYKSFIPKEIITKIKKGNLKSEKTMLKNVKEKSFEVHKNNKDLFIVTKGTVKYQYAITEQYDELGDYDPKKDFQKCYTIDYNEIILECGEFLIIDENVLHRPNLKMIDMEEEMYGTVTCIKIKVCK